MANLLTNAQFDDGTAGWSGGITTSASMGVVGGTRPILGPFPDPEYGDWSAVFGYQTVTVEPGVGYTLAARFAHDINGDGHAAALQVRNPATAALTTIESTDDTSGDWVSVGGTITAQGSTLEYRVTGVPGTGDTGAGFQWLVDDCAVVEMGITKDIKDALISDLNGISTAAGYNTDVKQVSREPVPIDEARKPHIAILPGGGGDSDLEALGNREGIATQRYTLQLVVQSSTPNADMDNLLDDIRNAIEPSDGSVMGVTGVEYAGLEDWSEVVTDELTHGQVYYREATVAVRYVYTRGSA